MKEFYKGGLVRRYHTWPIIGEQTVAAHSWGVAQILVRLWPESHVHLIKAVLDHDILEYYTGDIPYPAKLRFPELGAAMDKAERQLEVDHDIQHNLLSYEVLRLKACDLLELMMFSYYQMKMGNVYFERVWSVGHSAVREVATLMSSDDKEKVLEFVEQIPERVA